MEFEPRMPGRKANTITTELKRILPNAVVRYCLLNRKTNVAQKMQFSILLTFLQ